MLTDVSAIGEQLVEQKIQLQDSTGDTSIVRMPQELCGLLHCEVLQLWQVRRMALEGDLEVMCEPSNSTKSSKVTEARATHRPISGPLVMSINTRGQRRQVLGIRQQGPRDHYRSSNFLYHFTGLWVWAIWTHSKSGASSLT